jgi:hypothetical protein
VEVFSFGRDVFITKVWYKLVVSNLFFYSIKEINENCSTFGVYNEELIYVPCCALKKTNYRKFL